MYNWWNEHFSDSIQVKRRRPFDHFVIRIYNEHCTALSSTILCIVHFQCNSSPAKNKISLISGGGGGGVIGGSCGGGVIGGPGQVIGFDQEPKEPNSIWILILPFLSPRPKPVYRLTIFLIFFNDKLLSFFT